MGDLRPSYTGGSREAGGALLLDGFDSSLCPGHNRLGQTHLGMFFTTRPALREGRPSGWNEGTMDSNSKPYEKDFEVNAYY